jgi:uncharacterized membrane protein YccC
MPAGQDAQPDAWVAFWRSVVKFQNSKINLWLALRNTIGVATPLLIGAAVGELGAGLIASTGALQVAFRDSDEPYPIRGRLMLVGSVIAGIAVSIGALGGNRAIGAIVLAMVWAFATGMLVCLGQAAGEVGLMSLVLLVIYEAVPMPAERAALSGLAAFAGGLFQTALAVANWPIDPYGPPRRAMGDLYLELARAMVTAAQATDSPPATAQTIAAYNGLKGLEEDRSAGADRFRFLLSQAERLRLSLLALRRTRVRVARDFPAPEVCATVDRFIAEASRVATAIGYALKSGADLAVAATEVAELAMLTDQLRAHESPLESGMVADARAQMDALAGQLRSALDIVVKNASTLIPGLIPGPAPVERAPRPGFQDRLLTLRANLSFESAAFRHAVRLALCIGVGELVSHATGVKRPYWIPMTIAIVLRPDFGATFSRGVLRLIGTFFGIVLATGLVHVLPESVYSHIAIVAVLIFIVRSFGAANYGVFATAITAMVVLLVWLNGVAPQPVMAVRAVNTLAGGAIALSAYWLWPTWERHQVSEAMARMLDGFRLYFDVMREAYISRTPAAVQELERVRGAGRLARSNFEASAERAIAEPGVSAETVRLLGAMLASMHRFVQALLALEAAISASHVAPREKFHKFAQDVDVTLKLLAGALRLQPADVIDFPDLREDHHALIHSSESVGTYALVNVETDRITNSLNTLAGEIRQWIAHQA